MPVGDTGVVGGIGAVGVVVALPPPPPQAARLARASGTSSRIMGLPRRASGSANRRPTFNKVSIVNRM